MSIWAEISNVRENFAPGTSPGTGQTWKWNFVDQVSSRSDFISL